MTMPPSSNMPSSSKNPKDKWIPWYFVAAFLLLFVIDGILVYLAVSTQSGLVTDKAYERGLHYNDYLAEATAQKERGWQSDIAYENGQIIVTLKDKNGAPINGADIKISFRRPVEAKHDFDVQLAEANSGQYIKVVDFPVHGNWQARIFASWQNQPYQITKTLIIQ